MRKILFVIIVSIFTTLGAYAQNNMPLPQFSVGVNSGIAIGPVSNAYSDAGGLTLKLTYPIAQSPVSVTFKTGYTFYTSGGGYDVGVDAGGFGVGFSGGGYGYSDVASFIPVMAGLKVYISPRIFIAGEVGASFNVNSYPEYYTGKTTALIYSPSAGYTLPLGYSAKNSIDFSVAYENRVEPGGGYTQIALGVAYNFGF
jgi:hypothetical protein